MKNKYTFLTLCNAYDKIEIPIIQRDYAQGRDTTNVKNLREKFINNFLIQSLISGEPIELDFVYGSILTENIEDEKRKVFIPLDGQQRLTTLFLLHFFVALKENKLASILEILSKFTYETRPSARDFITKLLKTKSFKSIKNIKNEIEDSVWFDEDWKHDPSVSGMLNVLDTFANNDLLLNNDKGLLERLIDKENPIISFYFTDLDEFGLTENLYIRMNARGKMLTEFENFKSEFSKIIQAHHELLELVKDKIEYEWVDNLWDLREPDSFVIDKPFMSYLSFITMMLYFKNAEYNRSVSSTKEDFLDFKILTDIYSNKENLEFLIFSLDFVKNLLEHNKPVLWNGETLQSILKEVIQNKRGTNQIFILYNAILYKYKGKPDENLYDYLRVVRNLIANTDDNSQREWPRLLDSLESLISDKNVYTVLATDDKKLLGFRVEQRKEEVFKAKMFLEFPLFKENIFKIEDHKYLSGKISNILQAPFANDEKNFSADNLSVLTYNESKINELLIIFQRYEEIAENQFNNIWGNLLPSSMYVQTLDSRLVHWEEYEDHPSVVMFAKKYAGTTNLSLDDYIANIQKSFVTSLSAKYVDFKGIKDVKEQLYLYYIIEERIYNKKYWNFFKNNNFNFGWLLRETNYKSHFTNGVDGCRYFPTVNPIFQVYNQQFRYNLGINYNNTLDIEIIGGSKKRNPFELIQNWATN